ncbi:hypothetical protein [Mesorhizobium sp. A556]
MAGFGGLGGLGGSSYPQRSGSPASKQVMSDTEFTNDWQSRLDAIPQTVDAFGLRDVQLVPGSTGYNADFAKQFIPQVERAASQFGGLAPDSQYYTGGGGSHVLSDQTVMVGQETNPEYLAMLQQAQQAQQQRGENQTRQQQAYGSMNGWGQLNGVMGANYTDPNFGQISGQAGGPLTAPTMPDGVDPSWTSGVFDPSGGLTGVYGPNTSSKKQGFL